MDFQAWPAWLACVALLAVSAAVGLLASAVLGTAARRIERRGEGDAGGSLTNHLQGPLRLLLPALGARLVLPAAPLSPAVAGIVGHLLALLLIAALAWLALAVVEAAAEVISTRFRMDVPDNLAARQVQTQIQILRRVAWVVVGVVSLAAALMTFPDIRRLGISLFASAGVAGLVIGLAARPTLANLVAGIQLALTQPIRLDDVVIVEGEWGRIEEIRLTYVVVRIWDERRLVVPTSRFLDSPFQNWTRTSAELLGTAYLYADYALPVGEAREALGRILEETDLWDGRAWALQVTDATERSVQLRALMSARDAGQAWELRCHVRERLLAWMRERHPEALPRVRVEAGGPAPPSPTSARARDQVPSTPVVDRASCTDPPDDM